MAQADIIDLSRSSDEDSPHRAHAWRYGRNNPSSLRRDAFTTASEDDPFNLSTDFDLPLPPPKRRKGDAAHSPTGLQETAMLGTLPRPSTIRSQVGASRAGLARSRSARPASPPAPSTKVSAEFVISSDPPLVESESPSSPRAGAAVGLSLGTASLLAEISANARPRQGARGVSKTANSRKEFEKADSGNSGRKDAVQVGVKSLVRNEEKERRRVEKEAERERRKGEIEAERERKRAAKEQEKEQKDAEKQEAAELAVANKPRWDKSAATAEMIVDLPASIDGKPLEGELREVLRPLNVESTTYTSILPDIVRFRRKVTSAFNEELSHWHPVPEHIQDEKQILCLISGQHLLTMASTPHSQNEGVDSYLRLVRIKYPDFKITCLIDGLDTAIKRGAKSTRKAYSASVRGESQQQSGRQGLGHHDKGNSQGHLPEISLEDQIGEALVTLQVEYGCLVHHTESSKETAEFVASFTQQMSTAPYRQRLNGDTTFCMDFGQIRTGDDDDDTFIKMLQQVTRVTESVAGGIASQYPNVASLAAAFTKHGPLALEDLTKRHNANGARSDSRIGQALSKRLHNVFMGRDPEATDV